MCEESHFDSSAGLRITTWCGDVEDDKPKKMCDIDDQRKVKHFVEINNRKTFTQKVFVKGIVEKRKAKFEGSNSVVISETEWSYSTTVSGKFGLDKDLFGDVLVCKKSTGDEIVKVEVEYEDHWTPNKKNRADSNQLVLGIKVV